MGDRPFEWTDDPLQVDIDCCCIIGGVDIYDINKKHYGFFIYLHN